MPIQKTPLVSVIMNCLNGEQYLREAIDSVYAQTYDNWEIIFWDNASYDGTKKIAKSYDSKLKYFKSEVTSILGAARVLAVEKAKGEYFAFLDCDDIWYKEKLDKQMIMEYYTKHGLYAGAYKTSVKMNIIDESKIDWEEEDEAAGLVVEDE